MSDLYDDDVDLRPRRRPHVLALVTLGLLILLLAVSVLTSVWTGKLWFDHLPGPRGVSYASVFDKLAWTRSGLFCVFALLMALVVGSNIVIAYFLRPPRDLQADRRAGLTRYREVVDPARRVLLAGVLVLVAVFAGGAATGDWRTYLMWADAVPFGRADPWFGKDIGFYVFALPWWHFVVDFAITAVVLAIIATVIVHYLYGGIRLQSPTEKFTGVAQTQVCLLLAVLLLLRALGYWLDRYDLVSAHGSPVTGMTWTGNHAVLPGRTILCWIAVVCALLFCASLLRRSWLLVGVGVGVFMLSALLLGEIWPALVQSIEVKPDRASKEAPYVAAAIRATREAYALDDVHTTTYQPRTRLSRSQAKTVASSLTGLGILDPQLTARAVGALQHARGYYAVPSVLGMDRYPVDGRPRQLAVGTRDLDVGGLPASKRSWADLHTVYTHGYGVLAAYADQRDAAGRSVVNGGDPAMAEQGIPPRGVLGRYRPQIYFDTGAPPYAVVGGPAGGKGIESDGGGSARTTYAGRGGVPIGGWLRQLLYSLKFGDANLLLSPRVNHDSKILYDRSPVQMVQKVAPWLSVDSDALPAVVDGHVDWILDGYTTTDRYPDSQSASMQAMTSDSINPLSTFATLAGDQVDYVRNSVKAVVDAYDGTVTLYAWDGSDPILKTMERAFPGVVQPRSAIPRDLLVHMRYPADLFKVQRSVLGACHVGNPVAFTKGTGAWTVPDDPNGTGATVPAYRMSLGTGTTAAYSLASDYTRTDKQRLAAYLSVVADPTSPSYGHLHVLEMPPGSHVPGPVDVANRITTDPRVAGRVKALRRAGAKVAYGNLLTVPAGGGIAYVEPIYATPKGGHPLLKYVAVSFGEQLGIGPTLDAAFADLATWRPHSRTEPNTTTAVPPHSRLLEQLNALFARAEKARKRHDLAEYRKDVERAHALVKRALGGHR